MLLATRYEVRAQVAVADAATKKLKNFYEGLEMALAGMLEAPEGRVYLTAIEKNALVRFDPASRKTETVIEDKRLSWPDTLSWGPQETIYVTCSQIQNMPRFNQGKNARTEPYRVFKIVGAVDR